MSTDDAAPYELHLLETPAFRAERYLWHDPVQAVLSYNRLALEARRPAVLTKGRTLEGEAAEIIASYSPSDSAPPIRYRLTTAQPAFTEPRTARDDGTDRRFGALWYAYGFIDCIGGLSPFDREDAIAFADWHETESVKPGHHPIAKSWEKWSAQRRQEKGL